MRQITVFGSTGQGGAVTVEHELDKQIERVIKAAEAMFRSNGLWPPTDFHIQNNAPWFFDLKKAAELSDEIVKLKKLL